MIHKCIIFDCDGVLVDSETISAKVFHEMVLELGCNLDFEIVLEQITGTSMKENLVFFAKKIDGELPLNFEKEFRERSFKTYKKELKAIPGVRSLIDKIKVPICTASSGPQNKIRLNLTTTNLIDKFEGKIFSSYDIGSWKPDPGIYLHAAKQMGFLPKECAVIEDSKPGVIAAINGGFNVYAISSVKKRKSFTALGATAFSNMKELGDLLNID